MNRLSSGNTVMVTTARFRSFLRSLTGRSLFALVLAIALGLLGRLFLPGVAAAAAKLLDPVAELWLSALQLTVLPLVALMAVRAMTSFRDSRLGALGLRAVALFVAFLIGGALLVNLVGRPLLVLYRPDPGTASALLKGAELPAMPQGEARSFGEWVSSLLPKNLVRAAAEGQVLPVLIFSIVLGIALAQIPPERSQTAISVFHGLADAMLRIVQWIVAFGPATIFVLAFGVTQRGGDQLASFFLTFLVFTCGMVTLGILLLYPVTSILGRVGIRDFARAVAPAQVVAVTTRSSLVSLPAMIESAEILGLRKEASGFLLPLSTAVFKLNRTFTSTAKVLFVAHVIGMDLSAATMTTFTVTSILLSFAGAGIPSGGLPNLPAYIVSGVPIQAIVLLEAVDWISDVFMTTLNVTGDMSVATILGRAEGVLAATAVEQVR